MLIVVTSIMVIDVLWLLFFILCVPAVLFFVCFGFGFFFSVLPSYVLNYGLNSLIIFFFSVLVWKFYMCILLFNIFSY